MQKDLNKRKHKHKHQAWAFTLINADFLDVLWDLTNMPVYSKWVLNHTPKPFHIYFLISTMQPIFRPTEMRIPFFLFA